jgi:hypothetical protein
VESGAGLRERPADHVVVRDGEERAPIDTAALYRSAVGAWRTVVVMAGLGLWSSAGWGNGETAPAQARRRQLQSANHIEQRLAFLLDDRMERAVDRAGQVGGLVNKLAIPAARLD